MKQIKALLAVILVALFMGQAVCMVAAETSIQHPQVKVFGNVQKTVYVGRSIFEYKDDQGLSSTLPFERQDENVTIQFSNIVFSENFENMTITELDSSSTTMDLESNLLSDSYGNKYILIKVTNKTSIATNAYYELGIKQQVDITTTNDDYILVTAKPSENLDSVLYGQAQVKLLVIDEGGAKHWITIVMRTSSGTDGVVYAESESFDGVTADCISYIKYGTSNYHTLQVQIGTLLENAGVSYVLSKISRIYMRVGFKTVDTSITDSSVYSYGYFRHIRILSSKVYIDDPFYTNGLIVNGTSGDFTPQAGDIIQVYGANVTKIVGVTIPWQVEVTPEIDKDPDNLRMQYTWEWTMPKSPSEVGDTLTFSNTNMSLYGYKDGDAWDKLYLNGVDKLSSIASLKVPSDVDYWTYALASSLTEGNMYQVIARIQYTTDEYDSLTAAPLFWENPVAWILYKFWSLVIAVAAFLGLSATWMVKQRRKAQIPKVK